MPLFRSLPSIDRLPINVPAVAVVVLVVVLVVGGYFGALAPTLRQVDVLRGQLARAVEAARSGTPVPSVSPVTEEERKLWRELEERLLERYPDEPAFPRVVGEVANLARASGMELISLEIQTPQPASTAAPRQAPPPPSFDVPSELAVNAFTIRLVARHRYPELVRFLEGHHQMPVFVAVQSVEVKRVENALVSELSLVSLRWVR